VKVELSYPDITEEEIGAVVSVLRSQYLSMGPRVTRFEEEFADYLGKKYAIAVNSGTSGLHLAVKSLDIGWGDEVITTPFSFVASSNCLLYEGAKPIFVDIDPVTLNLDSDLIEGAINHRTRAVLPVDVFGYPVEMEPLNLLRAKYGLAIIEDACEALGSSINSKLAGTEGDLAVFAFYPNKQITTGEGGMIVTDDLRLASACRSMRNQGRTENSLWLNHEVLGYNYRLDEMSAALGLVQLKRLESIIEKREEIARLYDQKLGNCDWIRLPPRKNTVRQSWFVYVVQLDKTIDRDKVMKYLQGNGVGCRPYFSPIHLQPFYRKTFGYRGGEFPITEQVARSTLALPFHTLLGGEEIDYVVEQLTKAVCSQ
jgi:perosamine synthetase